MGGLLTGLYHQVFKQLAVFRQPDGIELRTEKPDAKFGQDAAVIKLNGHVEAGLPAQRGNNPLGLFLF